HLDSCYSHCCLRRQSLRVRKPGFNQVKRIEFRSWTDFRLWVDADRQVLPVYWRGQKDPMWPLASSFERQILRLNGGWKPGSSNVYPYDSRYDREGKKTWRAGF